MQLPAVSVLLPYTNEGELLQEAIQSILQQSFTDFELLLVANRADDHTLNIASSFNDQRIVRINETRSGIVYALNAGLRMARGEWIARMDADDIAHPERLQKQITFLTTHTDIDAVACGTTLTPATEENLGYQLFVEWQNSLLTPEEHAVNRFIESPVAHPAMVFRKKLIDQLGDYSNEELPEDYELWLRWMDNGKKIAKLNEKLLFWRDRPQRLSRTALQYAEQSFFEVKARYLKSYFDQHPDQPKKIIVCGGSSNNRWKIETLLRHGIPVTAVTDVVNRNTAPLPFIPAQMLPSFTDAFVINLIAKRDARESIKSYLASCGFMAGKNCIMAG